MSLKVLISDPDWRFARQATNYLEAHAHLVVSHPSARNAVACARHWQPDLIILSAGLADDTLMHELYALRPRPAILLAEHMSSYDRAWRAWQLGGDELLMKPVFSSRELHEAVVMALENAAANTISRPAAASA